MIESLILVEGRDVNEETLRSVSLGNAKQLVVGRVPDGGVVLHVAATAPADLGRLVGSDLLPSPQPGAAEGFHDVDRW